MDEILTVRAAAFSDPFRWQDVLANPQGPLPHVLVRLWGSWFGAGDLSLRLWAVTGGVLGLLLAAAVFRRLAPRASVLAIWLLALSPFHLWYSVEVRNYAYLLAVVPLVLWTFSHAVDRGGAPAWFLHGLSLAALFLCNLSGLLILPALGLWFLWERPRALAAWLPAVGVALLLVSPWLWVEFGGHIEWSGVTGEGTGPVRGHLTFHPGAVPFTFATYVGGFGLGPPLRELHEGLQPRRFLPHLPLLLPALLAALAGVAGAVLALRDPRVRLWGLWSFVPALIAAGVGWLGLKAVNPRYAAAAQPVFILFLAFGLTELLTRPRLRTLGRVAVAVLLAVQLVAWGRQTFDPRFGREDFRSAAALVAERAGAGDVIVQQGGAGPFERYHRGSAPVIVYYPVYGTRAESSRETLAAVLRSYDTVWWVGSRMWFEDPDRELLDWLGTWGSPETIMNRTGVEVIRIPLEQRPR